MQQDRRDRQFYDQTREPLRSAAPSNQPRTENGRYGYNGEPLNRPRTRTNSGQVRRTRADNSIQFPDQQRTAQPRRPASGAQRQAARSTAPRQTAGQRPPQRRAQNAAQNTGTKRLRPAGQQPVRDPARREKRKKRRLTRAAVRRRRLLRKLAAFVLLLVVIAAGSYLTMTMLFRIQTIQVQTADGMPVTEIAGYSSERILQVLGVQLEENIFAFEPGERESVLEVQFPLLESIDVVRQYPNTVTVRVAEAKPAYAMQSAAGWLTLSEHLKILTQEAQQPAGLTVLFGGEAAKSTPGEQLSFVEAPTDGVQSSSTDWMNILNGLRQGLADCGMLDDVTRIEFADPEQIAFLYQDRISVLLGTLNDLEYKLERAQYVLTNADGKGCAPTDTGKLDFSHTSTETTNRRIYFAQGEPTLPSGYVVPAPEPVEPEPQESTEQTEPAAEELQAEPQTETEGA